MGLTIALVGCGAMGSMLLKGWLTLPNSKTNFKNFWVIAPHKENVEPFMMDSRVKWVPSPQNLSHPPDVFVFAVKPFLLENIFPFYKSFNSLIISVAAGKSLAFYEKALSPSRPLIRAMPNILVGTHQGVIGLLTNKHVTPKEKLLADMCFQGLGFCTWVSSDEEIDKITAISGSGPAYVFYFIESLAQAAESLGFDKKTALTLALYTFWGASSYAHTSNEPPDILRQQVTSPQGTTAAALKVLETNKVQNLIIEAIRAAYSRAVELGK